MNSNGTRASRREPPGTVEYVSTVLLSWLIPGTGHFILGYRVRAVVLCVSIMGLFWTGETLLAKNLAVSREVSKYFFWVQAGNGLSTLVANQFWGEPTLPASNRDIDPKLPRHYNLGMLFTLLSGLLNMLLILHVMDPRSWTEEDPSGDPSAEPRGSPDEVKGAGGLETESGG